MDAVAGTGNVSGHERVSLSLLGHDYQELDTEVVEAVARAIVDAIRPGSGLTDSWERWVDPAIAAIAAIADA